MTKHLEINIKSNWKYDEYRNAGFHTNTRTFAYYFSRSDLEELRAIKE